MRNRSFGVLVVLAVALVAAPAFAFDKTFEATCPLHSGGSFALTNVNGSVEVQGWEREEVHVVAVKRSKTSPPDESRVQIEVEATPDAVSVHTRYPQEDGLDVTVEYRIQVPSRLLRARVETVNGSVRAREIEAIGELRTVNGDVELLDGAGRISARTTNGNIRLELSRFSAGREPVSVETVNGSVVLELSLDADADLNALSLNGDFRSELPLAVRSSEGSRELLARIGKGGALLRIRTVNGGIRILAARTTV